MVATTNEVSGTEVEVVSIENPSEVCVHDTKPDYSQMDETTGWEPAFTFEEGVDRVCEPSLDGSHLPTRILEAVGEVTASD